MPKFSLILCSTVLVALSACSGSDVDSPLVEPPPPTAPAAVSAVSITPTSAALLVGRTVQLTATPRDAAGTALSRTVTWTSSGNAVATVSSTGLVTAVAPGEARITATSESVSANVTITVSAVPVASVTLSTPGALVPRASQTLIATVQDSAGSALTGRTVTWASADTAIATVNASGVVTAVAAGTTKISATAEGHRTEVSAVVRDGGLITSAGGTATGASGTFSLTVPAGAVTDNVALTVDRIAQPSAHQRLIDGSAFRVAPAVITFAQSATLTMTYGALPAGVRARQLRVHRWNGASWQTLTSTVDTTTRRVTSSVSAAGDYALIEVPVPVASVVITPTAASLTTGDTLQLRASVRASDSEVLADRTVTWSSSNSGTATVSPTGLVRAVSAGTATITATSEGQSATVQVRVAAPIHFSSISVGALHSCGLTDDGEAWCWGDSEHCETGVQPCVDARPLPVRVNTTTRFASITPGTYATCGLSTVGAAWCWGLNQSGNLGNGNLGIRPVPAPVSGGLTFTTLSSGARHLCGLDAAGTAWCWGSNESGQLGTGNGPGEVTAPVRPNVNVTFRMIGTGSAHTCGLATDGFAWCWGANTYGESGTGEGVIADRPMRVVGNHVFTTLSVGEYHTCGIKFDGSVWCWGWSFKGQVGDGSHVARFVPVRVPSTDQFSTVYAFGWSTCALTTTGQARCWGENQEGQTGSVGDSTRYTPTPVSGSHTFRALASGGLAYHMCGITPADEWYCWGWNHKGQIGDGSRVDRHVPTRLPNPRATDAQAMTVRYALPAKTNSGAPRKVPPLRK